MPMTAEQARERILAGDVVRMEVEPDHIMRVWENDGMIYHVCVEGWSAGVVEPVCERESNFIVSYLAPHALEVMPADWMAGWAS